MKFGATTVCLFTLELTINDRTIYPSVNVNIKKLRVKFIDCVEANVKLPFPHSQHVCPGLVQRLGALQVESRF